MNFDDTEPSAAAMEPGPTAACNNPTPHTILLLRPMSPARRTTPKPDPVLPTEWTLHHPSCPDRLL